MPAPRSDKLTDKPDKHFITLQSTVIYPVGNKTHKTTVEVFTRCNAGGSTLANSTNQIASTYEVKQLIFFIASRTSENHKKR